MKKILFLLFFLLLSQIDKTQAEVKKLTHVPGEIIIGYEKLSEEKSNSSVKIKLDQEYTGLVDALNRNLNVSIKQKGPVHRWLVDQMVKKNLSEQSFLKEKKVTKSSVANDRQTLFCQQLVVSVDDDAKVDSIVEMLNNRTVGSYRIKFAVRNGLSYTSVIPDDPRFPEQWAHAICQADSAWNTQTGDSSVVIGILDTGVDYHHEDLKENIVPGYDFVDIDSLLFIFYTEAGTIIEGEDYITPDNDPMDYNGHGTHCAGIAGAVGNNSTGVIGASFNSSIMPLRVGYDMIIDSIVYGTMADADVASGIIYAANQGVDILSMSFGGKYSEAIRQAIDYASAQGVILIAAAGNSSGQYPEYPAALPNVISVGATDEADKRANFSNFGDKVDIMAPGSHILSTTIKGKGPLSDSTGYTILSGTSMATPYVAGVIALIKSEYPDYSNDEIIATLLNTTDDIDSLNNGFAGKLGAGRVNVLKSVTEKPRPNIKVEQISMADSIGNPKYTMAPGDKVLLNVRIKNSWLAANEIKMRLSTSDTIVSILDSVFIVDHLPMNKVTTNASQPFSFTVHPSAQDHHLVRFSLQVEVDERRTELAVSYPVCICDTLRIPSDYATIQKGIDASFSGDLILIEPGEYFENIDFKGKNIIVASRYYDTGDEAFIPKTILNGSMVTDTLSTDNIHGSVVYIGNGETRAAKLIGLTLTKGTGTNFIRIGDVYPASMGGAVFCYRSSPELRHLRIIENTATSSPYGKTGVGICMNECQEPPLLKDLYLSENHGASAISAYYGNILIKNITINDNTSGIGIYFYSNSGSIADCSIQNCTGSESSAIEIAYADSVFIHNTQLNNNGYCGIYSNTCRSVVLQNAEINNNNSYGGLFQNSNHIFIWNSVIKDNTSKGGFFQNSNNIFIRNSVIKDNNSDGALFQNSDYITILNSSFSHNLRSIWIQQSKDVKISQTVINDNRKGGIELDNSTLTMANVTVANNTINNNYGGAAIFSTGDSDTINIVNSIFFNNKWITLKSPVDTSLNTIGFLENSGRLTIAYSNIENSKDGIFYSDGNGNIQTNWLEGNLDTLPMFYSPEKNDFHLMENSPLKNKGTAFIEFKGDTLVNLDSSAYIGSQPDMGAYLSPVSFIKSDFAVDQTLGEVPLTVHFKNLSYAFNTAAPDSFVWVFGGKDTSYVFEPSYTFTEQGTFTVELYAYNSTMKDVEKKINLISTYAVDTFFVDNGGVDSLGYGTELYPFKTIQYAVNNTQRYDLIIVNPGLYVENITLSNKDLTLASRYLLTKDTTFISTTIIDGNKKGSVITLSQNTSKASIAGLTIRNGAKLEKGSYSGGGIDLNHSDCQINSCIIRDNVARHYGGGLHILYSNPVIENCLFLNNDCDFQEENKYCVGGGICVGYDSSPTIKSTAFINNQSGKHGGGIYNYSDGNLTLDRLTFYNNISKEKGGGIYVDYNNKTTITNSIFWDNEPQQIFEYKSGDLTVSYSDIENGHDGVGNINSNPKFVDSEHLNFSLHYASKCIDSGDPSSDLDPDNTRADMGAFPYDQNQFAIHSNLADQTICANEDVYFFVSATGEKPITCSWFCNDSLVSTSDTLLIKNASDLNSGVYHCHVSDAANHSTETYKALLVVLPSSKIKIDTTICEGESYFAGGQYQNVSGIYTDTIQNQAGCDSIIITKLAIVNCQGNQKIAGKKELVVYPNPTKGDVTIQSDLLDKVVVYNGNGEALCVFYTKQFDLSFLPDGIYYLKVFQSETIHSLMKITLKKE